MVDDTQKNVDSIQQLLRRLNVIVYHYINKDGKYRAFKMPASEYVDAKDMIERAREYEKIADEVEAIEDIDRTETQATMDEIMDGFGAEEVKDEHD